jgi:trehalose 6-phosphate synthase
VRRIVQPDDYVWVHDYQLMLVGHHLRRLGVGQKLGYFLHIPFPGSDLFRRIPWKEEMLRALLDYDLLGFQTARDRSNFVRSVRELLPTAVVTAKGRQTTIQHEGRVVTAGHFPISIDFREFYDLASTPEVANAAAHLREEYKCDQMILGVDQLDYTKGVGERYLALAQSLEDHPELIGKISLIQLVIPSRARLPEYKAQKAHVDELAGRINGRFSRDGWVPIHYMYRTLDRASLVAMYRACDIALITPLRDGMNLVAKEYCASSVDGNGVLILSEFAGSAEQLGEHSLLVNPYDREGIADAINVAYHMPRVERQRRMQLLQAEIRRNDVHRWLKWILEPSLVG